MPQITFIVEVSILPPQLGFQLAKDDFDMLPEYISIVDINYVESEGINYFVNYKFTANLFSSSDTKINFSNKYLLDKTYNKKLLDLELLKYKTRGQIFYLCWTTLAQCKKFFDKLEKRINEESTISGNTIHDTEEKFVYEITGLFIRQQKLIQFPVLLRDDIIPEKTTERRIILDVDFTNVTMHTYAIFGGRCRSRISITNLIFEGDFSGTEKVPVIIIGIYKIWKDLFKGRTNIASATKLTRKYLKLKPYYCEKILPIKDRDKKKNNILYGCHYDDGEQEKLFNKTIYLILQKYNHPDEKINYPSLEDYFIAKFIEKS